MIYTVTFNPALDYVVFLDNLKLGDVNRSTRESIFYGGKGINVSTILNTLGLETTALGFVAGFTGKAIEDDLHDADGKLGRKTLSTAASIGGQWGGAALGAKLGAMLGTATTIYAPVAVPILSLVGGAVGAFAGDALAKWVVDITYVGE